MTRRERLERKAEHRREWAEKRRAKASAAISASTAMVSAIPMGQPILVGHHSEKAHRRLLEKADNAMRRGCESESMAAHHEARADGIEDQLECIFSDDVDAVEKLQEKIAREEQIRNVMKQANAIIRKSPRNESTPEKQTALAALGIPEAKIAALFTPNCFRQCGFADSRLRNLGANIRRMKNRLQVVEVIHARKEAAEASDNGVTIEGGEWVRITFAEKPDRDILKALKAAGFSWRGGSWVGPREQIPESVGEMVGQEIETTATTEV